jgi:hypothetical protein
MDYGSTGILQYRKTTVGDTYSMFLLPGMATGSPDLLLEVIMLMLMLLLVKTAKYLLI